MFKCWCKRVNKEKEVKDTKGKRARMSLAPDKFVRGLHRTWKSLYHINLIFFVKQKVRATNKSQGGGTGKERSLQNNKADFSVVPMEDNRFLGMREKKEWKKKLPRWLDNRGFNVRNHYFRVPFIRTSLAAPSSLRGRTEKGKCWIHPRLELR